MKRRARLLLLPVLAAGLAAGTVMPAQARPGAPTTSIVSMGDSYISGEGGRWAGNSLGTGGNSQGTDLAYENGSSDPARVYSWTADNGCHRSNKAEILTNTIAVNDKQNIACSGAKSENIWRASHGGQSFKGEAPQADRLAGIAATRDVKMIVLSIGGNDLGFSDIIESCAAHYMFSDNSCHAGIQEGLNAKMATAMAGVGKSIDEIRAVMTANGYATKDYRLVLQSYPSPVPRASQLRPKVDRLKEGCPMYNADLDWARLSLIPRISSELRAVATKKGTEFLDLQDLFDRHEVCSATTVLADATHSPSRVTSEWARFLALLQGGDAAEYFHPNAFGQVKIGSCLSLLNHWPRGQYDCSSYDDIEYINPLLP